MCNDINEPPRAGMGEVALAWQKEPGWDHMARGAKVSKRIGALKQ